MPSRVIRGEINASDSLARVSMQADLTFRALIVAVDDFGRLDARPAILKAVLFPTREEVKPAHITQWIEELVREGCVELYEVGTRQYLVLSSWEHHRGAGRRGERSKYPPPPGCTDAQQQEGVYFIQSGKDGPIKIGHTKMPTRALKDARKDAHDVRFLGFWAGKRALEKKLHRQFAASRGQSGWFEPTPELLDLIEEHKVGIEWAEVGMDVHVRALPFLPRDEGRGTRDEGRGARGEMPAPTPIQPALRIEPSGEPIEQRHVPEPWQLSASEVAGLRARVPNRSEQDVVDWWAWVLPRILGGGRRGPYKLPKRAALTWIDRATDQEFERAATARRVAMREAIERKRAAEPPEPTDPEFEAAIDELVESVTGAPPRPAATR